MRSQVGAMVYGGADVERTGAVAAFNTEAFADWAALRAAVEDVDPALGRVIEFGDRCPERPFRFDLGLTIQAAAGAVTADEDLYIVTPLGLEADRTGLLIEKIADLAWTGDLAAPVPPALGGRVDHKWATAVVVTDPGVCAARSGVAIRSVDGKPATVTVYDPGVCVGIVRLLGATGAATAVAPLIRRWL